MIKYEGEIREMMIEVILRNLPIFSMRQVADGYYSLLVSGKGYVTGSDYAEGISQPLEELGTNDLYQLYNYLRTNSHVLRSSEKNTKEAS